MRKKKIEIKKIINMFSNQKGMALLATLIFVFVLGSIGVALLTMTGNDSKLSTLQRESNRAFYLAETGIEKALWFMNFSPDNPDGIDWRTTEEDPYLGGNATEKFKVVITTVETDAENDPTKIKFLSTGIVDNSSSFNQGKRTIEVILLKDLALNNSLSYNYAVLTDNDMTINGNIFINGDIHANGDLSVQGDSFELANGTASATGTITGYPEGIKQGRQDIPVVIFKDYYNIATSGGGHYYGDNTSVIFSTTDTITGIHYIDGDVIIKPPCDTLTISDGAIFATGTITVSGGVDVYLERSETYTDNPYALVSKDDITIGGNIHGEGIIQTEGSFTLNGEINIQKGCIVAENGILNGGGGTMNIVYDNGSQDEVVDHTAIEVWKKVSWQEVY